MLKTISAVLLAVSVLAAPALAANPGKATQAQVVKTEQAKPNLRNANAEMIRHHRHHRHHRHKRMGALRAHQVTKLSIKHTVPATKRG
jgi:Ni/Co efflux regulator RcnB